MPPPLRTGCECVGFVLSTHPVWLFVHILCFENAFCRIFRLHCECCHCRISHKFMAVAVAAAAAAGVVVVVVVMLLL